MATTISCFNCNKELTFPGNIGRREECPFCRSDVHVCKNCEHYDPTVTTDARDTPAEAGRQTHPPNFCDYFTPRKGSSGGIDKAAALRAAAEALFKKS
jgi:hypothetical protein